MKTNDVIIELVRKVKKGDNVAFTDLYNETYKYLHTCVIHIVKDEDVAQDMLQDTYVEIYKNIGQLKDDAGFLGWASTIANRKCFAYLKKNKDLFVDDQTDDEGNSTDYFENIADDEAFIPENIFDNIEKINIIRGIIDELTDVQRACVIGFYYNEQKQDQIADELGIPVNTVKSHLNRAKSKIKEAVGDIEKKQGIKLLSVMPFMVALFGFETKAYAAECVVPAMSASIAGAVATKGAISTGTATVKATGTALKSAGMVLKTKIAIGAVAGVVGVGVVVGTINQKNSTFGDDYDENYEEASYENRKQDAYEEKKAEVLRAVDRCKINKDIHGALKIIYDAREEYPEDEFFFELQQKLMLCQPDYIEEKCNIISKKGCKVGLDTIELDNGEKVTEDFSINFGGGNIVLDLSDKYKVVDLKVFLSNMAPTKGLIDIDFICDGVVMDCIKGFDVYCDLIEKSIDVTGVKVLEISVIDCTHDWVGEASFSKPDAECHFTFRAYTEKSIEWR